MNLTDPCYAQYALVREMMDTIHIVEDFQPSQTSAIATKINSIGRLLLTGEGSSRIFPAKNAIRKALTWGLDLHIYTEGSRQAALYELTDSVVFCTSNSGRTKEVVTLADTLTKKGHGHLYGLTANKDTPLERSCKRTFVLSCGWEQAVAATKSVVEQGLFYESILWHIARRPLPDLKDLASKVKHVLTMPIDRTIIDKAVNAKMVYLAGYNDGVAEELTLKTNEITRKKSDLLEGTYAVHGIEEVMDPQDIVFWIDPIDQEMDKFQQVLCKGVGLTVVALADRQTPFPTILVPSAADRTPYLYLCAGWNLLVEIGLASGINLDKPTRARKIGNEFTG